MRANVDEIDFVFRHEREIREAVLEAKLGTGGHTGGTTSGHSYVSDPTPASAIRRVEEVGCVTIRDAGGERKVYKPERWLAVISAVREWCGRDTIRAEIFRRVLSRPVRLKRCEARYVRDDICKLFHIERSEYYRKFPSIFDFAEGYAKGIKLL